MKTATIETSFKTADGLSVLGRVTQSAGAVIEIDEAVPDSSTDLEIAAAFAIAKLAACVLYCDQAVTVEFSDGAGVAGSVSLAAGDAYVWQKDSGIDCLITDDVDGIFCTNSSGSDATLKAAFLYDPT